MKVRYVKVIFGLILLLSFAVPNTVAGMPADVEMPPEYSTQCIEIPLTALTDVDHLAPPATEVSAQIGCNKAVFVDEQNPTTNMNGGANRAYLRVGIGPEFGGELWTLLSFSPVKQSQGGPLPNDAEITRAQIKMYKESGVSGTVRVHIIGDDFNENSVNWNNKPHTAASSSASASVPATNGWCNFDIPAATVSDFVRFNNPVRLALRPSWTNIGKSCAFYSNEHPSLAPKLVIYYKGAAAPPGSTPVVPPTPPAPSSSDTSPCTITYTITPTNPSPGQQVTITATATDDQAMYYLTIMRGSLELARRDAASGQRQLQVSYTETASLPSVSYQIFADDLGPASPVSRMVTVPVAGSGSGPIVTVTAEWLSVERVIPEKFRLIKNDRQQVRITAEASDPDGIRDLHIFVNGIDHPFTYTGQPTSVSESVFWENNQSTRIRFSYYAQARDREGQTATAQGGDHQINQPQDIRLMWHETPPFDNFGSPTISWERMCQIFGDGECWNVKAWGWRDLSAEDYWEDHVKTIADGGNCQGFATLALELYNGRIAASQLQNITGGAWELDENNAVVKAWIEARQGGQAGEEVRIPRWERRDYSPQDVLSQVEYSLESDDLCVIGIYEGDGGHAVVPWMVKYMPDDTVRVYIYDCNDVAGIHNPNADINNFAHYPYIVIDGDSWSYQWNATTVWNDTIKYDTYHETCGDMGEAVSSPRLGTAAALLSDHDIPNSTDWYVAWASPGSVDTYFEDEKGNITGLYQGQIREEIPGSMAVRTLAGPFSEHEMYILPAGKKLSIHAEGTNDGEYNLNLLGQSTLYSVKKKNIRKGIQDTMVFEPWGGSLGYRLEVQPGVEDDNFMVMVAVSFEGVVAALNSDSIDREYIMDEVSATDESDFSIFVEEGGDAFVVESYGDDIQFDAVTRSTESADVVDPNTNPGYIPASVEEDVTVEQGRRAEITPETWSSSEEKAKLHTLNKRATGKGGNFPLIPVIIGVVVVAIGAAAVFLIKKGKAKKAA